MRLNPLPTLARLSPSVAALVILTLAGAACSKREDPPAPVTAAAIAAPAAPQAATGTEIAWFAGGVEEAFAEAEQAHKPVLLYWGAQWCPPCNQLKATVFKRPDFVARTRQFVPVYLDGDSRGAQQWGEHFAISGYPTLIVLDEKRVELTRIAGGLDLEQYPKVLDLAQRQTGPIAQVLERALAAPPTATDDDWARLALYGWDLDEERTLKEVNRAATMGRLAASAPPGWRPRFELLALIATVTAADDAAAALAPEARPAAQRQLTALLGDARLLRQNLIEIQGAGADLVRAATTPGSPERQALVAALAGAMDRSYADASLTVLERLDTAFPELQLHQAEHEGTPPPGPQAAKMRERALWAAKAAQTSYERQAVVGDAADVLDLAGHEDEAEKLLREEIKVAHAPYYHMVSLALLLKERKDVPGALEWFKRAWETAQGPATRAQWANYYVEGLIDLRPTDAKEIETVMTAVIDELAAEPGAYYQRTRGRLASLATKLRTWSAAHDGEAVLQRLDQRIDPVCQALPEKSEARVACDGFPRSA